jgi:hypothetical protein
LPVEYVTVPVFADDNRFSAPRALNAPTGWVFSCLTSTVAPTASLSTGYDHIGVGGR